MPTIEEFTAQLDARDAGVAKLRERARPIQEVIPELVKLYVEVFGVSAYKINQGLCEDFANDVCELVTGAEAHWGDELIDGDEDQYQFGYHCIVWYDGLYFDSEHPTGELDFRNMSAFWPPNNPYG